MNFSFERKLLIIVNDLWALDYIPGNFLGYNNEFDFESMIHLN